MKTKFSKGDLVYDVEYNRLMIVNAPCFHQNWLFCEYSFNPKLFYYMEEKHLTLISKGEFK